MVEYMAEEQKQNNPKLNKRKWWILGGVILSLLIFTLMFILGFVWYYYFVVYFSIALLILFIFLMVKSIENFRKRKQDEFEIKDLVVMRNLALKLAREEMRAGEIAEIHEVGTSHEKLEGQDAKVPVYTLWFKESEHATTYAVCINHSDPKVSRVLRNPTKEMVKELRKEIAGTVRDMVTTEKIMTDQFGNENIVRTKAPLVTQPIIEKRIEEKLQ